MAWIVLTYSCTGTYFGFTLDNMPRAHKVNVKSGDKVNTPSVDRRLRSREGTQPTLETALGQGQASIPVAPRRPLREVQESPCFGRPVRMRAKSATPSSGAHASRHLTDSDGSDTCTEIESIEITDSVHSKDAQGMVCKVARVAPGVAASSSATQTWEPFLTKAEALAMFPNTR